MSLAEFGSVMRGVALRNGKPIDDAPSEDEFLEALALSTAEGLA